MSDSESNRSGLVEFIEGCSLLVVTVSYQSADLVFDCLESLRNDFASLPDTKVVIVDNTCGQDAKILNEKIQHNAWHHWVKVVISERNGGFSYGNNLAIRPALSAKIPPQYIWLLNPDTQVFTGAGSALIAFLESNAKAGIAGSCLINEDGTEWGVAFRYHTIFSELEYAVRFGPFSRLLKNHVVARKMANENSQVDWLPGASMMIRRDVFSTAGLFDQNYFLYYEETDFCLAASMAGWTTCYVPSSKVLHISGQSTGATGKSAISKRLPTYMFDSRYHYFTKNHGLLYATIADLVRISGLVANKVINLVRKKSNSHHPHFLTDCILNFSLIKYIKVHLSKSGS